MPPTKRERYEALQQQIQKTVDAWEDRDMKGVTQADVEVLHVKTTEARQLRRELEAEKAATPHQDYGGISLNALASPAGGGWSPEGGYSSKAAGPWGIEMKGYLERIGTKTITPSGSITVPSLSRGIVAASDRPTSILQMIPFEKLDGTDSFSYLQESVRTHGASTVAVGALKPTSIYSVVKVDDRVRVIATLSEPMDRSMLMDVALLQQYLEGSLKSGVMLELENQVLNGDETTTGVTDQMVGVLNASPGTQTFATDALTSARKAVTQLEDQNLDPAGFGWVMSSTSWETLELLTSDTPYTLSDPGRSGSTVPVDRARRALWGYPVTTSTVLDDDVAILGDWRGSARVYEREGVRVDWSDAPVSAGTTAFEKNQLVFRAEGRWGLGVLRPAAFIVTELAEAGP